MIRKSAILFLVIISGVSISGEIEMKGVSYTAWSPDALYTEDSDISLADANAIGCNWIAICVWWFQDSIDSAVIEPDYSRYSAEPGSVVHAIERCHELGMKVMLKPMVDCRDGKWRGDINPSAGWFAAYQDFVTFWADLAAANGVELFCVGCELKNTESWSSSWQDVIQEVKNHYTGPFTYAANHGCEQKINWWGQLDYIGIDAYYSLTNKNNPTLSELKTAWNNRCNSIEAWRNSSWPSMDIIFTEVGYQSVDGTNRTPWWTDPAGPIDLQEQADCYEALLSQCKGRSWWLGAFWWNWETDPDAGGPNNPYHLMQNKPAEQVLCNYYSYIIFVDANSPYDPGSGTSTEPFRRIQDAINAAEDGDIIKIRPGIYSGEGNYDLDPSGKGITICSIEPEDANIVASTIIDPNREGRGFFFQSGEDGNCVVWGLTIQDGYGGKGGGIFCEDSSPTINNCTIRDSTAMTYGGGIFCRGGSPHITGCIISSNLAMGGGGIECWSGQPVIRNCLIAGNMVWGDGGGGVDCYDSGNAMLRSCTIAGNLASEGVGGGLLCNQSDVEIENSIFRDNDALQGPQIAVPSWFGPANATVAYSDAQGGKAAVDVGPLSSLNWGSGNIDSDPCFVRAGRWDDNGTPADTSDDFWVDGDYHLRSQTGRWDANERRWTKDDVTSPCIDAGDPNSDWSGEPWPNGKRINMGAYGGTNHASMSGNPGDFNLDGVVNFKDFCELASKWRLKGKFFEDLNSNGAVDIADVGEFAETWLWKRE